MQKYNIFPIYHLSFSTKDLSFSIISPVSLIRLYVFGLYSLMLTEICGCLAEMFFYIFAKEGRIGETEQVANLLDAVVGLLQVVADVL